MSAAEDRRSHLRALLVGGTLVALAAGAASWTVSTQDRPGSPGLPPLFGTGRPAVPSPGAPDGGAGLGSGSGSPAPTSAPFSEPPTPAVVGSAPVVVSTPPASLAPSPAPSANPPPAPLSGEYRLTGTSTDGFTGQVVITNPAPTAQSWQVVLRFPAGVGSLRRYWVDGAGAAGAVRSGQEITFAGTSQIAPGATVTLGFEFEKHGGRDDFDPISCTVNGTACAGVAGYAPGSGTEGPRGGR